MKICNDMPQGVYFENKCFWFNFCTLFLPKVLPGMVAIFLESLLVLRKSDTFTTMLWGLYFR